MAQGDERGGLFLLPRFLHWAIPTKKAASPRAQGHILDKQAFLAGLFGPHGIELLKGAV